MIPHVKSAQLDAALPHKLCHYMYMKRPVVTTDCVPLVKVVQDADCGLIYESGNAQKLGEALVYLYRNPQERQRMGENGHRAVIDRYNWDSTVQGMVRMYRELSLEYGG